MSLASATNSIQHTGAANTATYSYTFKIFDDDDLTVVVMNTDGVETTLTKTTDYTVTGVDESAGGTIVLVNASQAWLTGGFLKTGYLLTIRREVDLLQSTDIRNQGDGYREIMEDQFDYQTMIDHQQQFQIDRSVKLPPSVLPANFSPLLPTDIEDSPRHVIAVDDDGDGLQLLSEDDLTYGLTDGSTSITSGQSATNATGWTLNSTNYTSGEYLVEYTRGTTVMGIVHVVLLYLNSSWIIREGNSIGEGDHGLTFTLTGTSTAQVQVAADSSGNGTIKWKGIRFDA